jgi:putative NADPH-quinone reductase
MKSICFINGSFRGKKASSLAFLEDVNRKLSGTKYHRTFLTVRAGLKGNYPEDMLQSMAAADAIIMVFPLFSYGIPGGLMRLLEDYYRYIQAGNGYSKDAKVYVIVNCGFPRPAINEEAIRVIKNFCRRLSLNWRFAICIGSGPVVVATRKVPFLDMKLKKAYAEIASDIQGSDRGEKNNYLIKPILPEPIILMIKNQFEKKMRLPE